MLNTLNDCTYQKTGKNYQNQYWRTCYDCFKDQSSGACLNCVQICHNGHRVGPLQRGNFYCDCGSGDGVKSCELVREPFPQPFPQPFPLAHSLPPTTRNHSPPNSYFCISKTPSRSRPTNIIIPSLKNNAPERPVVVRNCFEKFSANRGVKYDDIPTFYPSKINNL